VSDLLLPRNLVLKGTRTDGRPAGYWQQYADDVGPFEFPLVSPLITKRLVLADPERVRLAGAIKGAYSWLLCFLLLAVQHDSLFWLMVAAVGFVVRCRGIVLLLVDMYPDVGLYFSHFGLGGLAAAPASGGALRWRLSRWMKKG
jgi:hypothetical protein